MFRLFQLDVPRSEFDAVNDMGWAEAMEKFPRIEAHMALTLLGSEAYVTEYDQYFQHVADIKTQGVDTVEAALEQCFHVHNNSEGLAEFEAMITRYGSQHNMSVGDILVDPFGGVHMVDNYGFTQLLSSFVGYNKEAA